MIGELHNPETHLIPIIVDKILNNKSFRIYGTNYNTKDGSCIRDYIHILDIISAIKKSLIYLDKEKKFVSKFGL